MKHVSNLIKTTFATQILQLPAPVSATAPFVTKTSYMNLDTIAWCTVAQHLPAQPVLYLRMATVSRQFYGVFMSDQIWERVNVYGIERQISRHYLDMLLPEDKQLDLLRQLYDGKFDPEKDEEFAQLDWMEDHLYALYQAFTVPILGKPFLYWRLNPSRCVRKIIAESGRVWQLTEEGKKDKDLALLAVSYYGPKLRQLPEGLKRDKDVVLAAVRNNGMALEFADASLQRDKEIMHAAVFQNGAALKWAHLWRLSSAASDRIVLTAIRNNPKKATAFGVRYMRHTDCVNAMNESFSALERVNNPEYDPSRAWVFAKNNPPKI